MSCSLRPGAVDSILLAVGVHVMIVGRVPAISMSLAIPRAWLAAAGLAVAVVTASAAINVTAPSGMPTGRTVTAEQLWLELDHALPAGVWVSPLESTHYEVLSAKWMRRTFIPALKRQLKTLVEKGIPEDNTAGNCSGFALIGRLMLSLSAMEAHARTPAVASVIVTQNEAFGGLPATLVDHCVAFVLTDEGPWIIEVQSGAYIHLSAYPNRGTIKLVSVH